MATVFGKRLVLGPVFMKVAAIGVAVLPPSFAITASSPSHCFLLKLPVLVLSLPECDLPVLLELF